MRRPASFANAEVLAFYQAMPFHYFGDAEAHAAFVRSKAAVDFFLQLPPLIRPGTQVLDVGCGTGWLAHWLAFHCAAQVTAIDFNPVAVERAQEVARLLDVEVGFEVADLFHYERQPPFDIVTSVGVLHHTDDCHGAVERLCRDLMAPGGHLFLGLYHAWQRRPFLDHFAAMRDAGAGADAMLAEFRRLDRRPLDDTLSRSWFRDQVLHPHETQHTLRELLPPLAAAGMTVVATSLNGFGPIEPLAAVLALEEGLLEVGRRALEAGRYDPGFFVVIARKSA